MFWNQHNRWQATYLGMGYVATPPRPGLPAHPVSQPHRCHDMFRVLHLVLV